MPAAPEGSITRPYRQTLFSRLREVHWTSGGVVIVEVKAPETKFYEVAILDPPDNFLDSSSNPTIVEADYAEHFGISIGLVGSEGTVVVEDELTDVWIWDGFVIGELGDEPANGIAVAAATASFGYAPSFHLTGQQIAHDTSHFGAPMLGDYVTHTHPNGSAQVYSNGYTALGTAYSGWHGPGGDFTGYTIRPDDPNGFPEPAQDLSNTESWYWRRITTRPQSTAAVLRRSYLVNVRQGWTRLAELRDVGSLLDYPTEWSIRGFPQGTGFTVADGVATPVGPVLPRFEASGVEAGGHDGTIRKFNGSGFVA